MSAIEQYAAARGDGTLRGETPVEYQRLTAHVSGLVRCEVDHRPADVLGITDHIEGVVLPDFIDDLCGDVVAEGRVS